VQGPFWSPFSVHAPECPDLWRDGETWRLLFSNGTTQCRTAPALREAWLPSRAPEVDGRWLYAAKCFHAEGRHLLALQRRTPGSAQETVIVDLGRRPARDLITGRDLGRAGRLSVSLDPIVPTVLELGR